MQIYTNQAMTVALNYIDSLTLDKKNCQHSHSTTEPKW